jgi:hypothetical protein
MPQISNGKMRYKHQIDLWVKLILFGIVFMLLPLVFVVPPEEQYIMIISMVGMAIIILPFMYGYLEFTDDYVLIRMHVFRQKIYYDKIKSIRLCRNWFSSMAMTVNRIEIKVHNKGFILGTTYIGPTHREEFFDELKRRCHNLESDVTDPMSY